MPRFDERETRDRAMHVAEVEYLPDRSRPRRAWRRRLLQTLLLLFALGAIGVIVAYKWSERIAQKDLDAVIAELDSTDPNWRLADIEATRKVIPDQENAALVVMDIVSRLPKPWPSQNPNEWGVPGQSLWERINDTPLPQMLEPALQGELLDELERVKPLLPRARSLAHLSEGRFPIAWAKNPLGTSVKCQDAREAVSLLRLDAYAQARENDIEGACISCRAAIVAGRSIGDEMLLISQIVRLSCVRAALNDIERTLAQGQSCEATLAALQRLLEDEEDVPHILTAARGERAVAHEVLEGIKTGQASVSQFAAPRVPNRLQAAWDSYAGPHLARQGHAPTLQKLTEFVEIVELPLEEQDLRLRLAKISLRDPDMPLMMRLLYPAIDKYGQSNIVSHAHIRCAIAALAAERFRLAKGRWPKEVAEMVPGLLPKLLLDPYDAQPLRLRALPDGIVIYSLGPGHVDNGGVVNKQNSNSSNIAFHLWDVSARRRPARNPDVGPPQPTKEELDQLEFRQRRIPGVDFIEPEGQAAAGKDK
jgi:hypothetical protein